MECLEDALRTDARGIRGGGNYRQRRGKLKYEPGWRAAVARAAQAAQTQRQHNDVPVKRLFALLGLTDPPLRPQMVSFDARRRPLLYRQLGISAASIQSSHDAFNALLEHLAGAEGGFRLQVIQRLGTDHWRVLFLSGPQREGRRNGLSFAPRPAEAPAPPAEPEPLEPEPPAPPPEQEAPASQTVQLPTAEPELEPEPPAAPPRAFPLVTALPYSAAPADHSLLALAIMSLKRPNNQPLAGAEERLQDTATLLGGLIAGGGSVEANSVLAFRRLMGVQGKQYERIALHAISLGLVSGRLDARPCRLEITPLGRRVFSVLTGISPSEEDLPGQFIEPPSSGFKPGERFDEIYQLGAAPTLQLLFSRLQRIERLLAHLIAAKGEVAFSSRAELGRVAERHYDPYMVEKIVRQLLREHYLSGRCDEVERRLSITDHGRQLHRQLLHYLYGVDPNEEVIK
jgi:hypothetical protein